MGQRVNSHFEKLTLATKFRTRKKTKRFFLCCSSLTRVHMPTKSFVAAKISYSAVSFKQIILFEAFLFVDQAFIMSG